MKISIKKSILESILLKTQNFQDKKDISQITSHVLLKSKNEKIEVKSTDNEFGISILIKEDKKNINIIEDGGVTINGKKLSDIIRILKDKDIKIESIENSLWIKQDNSKFKLPIFNESYFPKFPSIKDNNEIKIDSTSFVENIKKVESTIDNNNPKMELNGAFINIKDDFIDIVATDTKRLSLSKIKNENKTEKKSLIIPKKAISEIRKLFNSKIDIFSNNKILFIKSLGLETEILFFTKLTNGKFPDYEKIIPKEMSFNIKLNKDSIIENIKQVSVISENIKITFDKKSIDLYAKNFDNNSDAIIKIDQDIDIDEKKEITVNNRHIMDFLSNIYNYEFILGFNDSNMPFILKGDNFITVAMPIME